MALEEILIMEMPDYHKIGLKLLNRGEYSESIKYFNKVLDDDPTNLDSLYEKSYALSNIGKYKEQLDSLETILTLDPKNKRAMLALSDYHHYFRHYEKELEILEKVLKFYPDDPKIFIYKSLALSYIKNADFNKLLNKYLRLIEDDPTNFELKALIANLHGNLDEAIYYYKKLLEKEINIDTYYDISYAYYNKDDVEKSKKYLNKCLDINPNYIPALLLFSLLLQESPESEIYLDKVLKINPNHFVALSEKAWIILDDKKRILKFNEVKNGEKYVNRALEIIPNDPQMLKLKASCLTYFGKYDESCKFFKKSMEIDPNDETLYTSIAITLSSKQNYEKALEYCEKARRLDPDFSLPLFRKGQIKSRMGEYTKAVEYYDQYLELEKNDINALILKSSSLVSLKKYSIALDIVENAIKLDPERISSWIAKGKIYHYFLKDLAEAVKIYKYALEKVEEDPELYYHLKNALKSLGNLEESRYYEKKIIESDIIALEKQLEDKLVKDLSVFEEHGFLLKLIERQHHCKNSEGNKRIIDILCKNSHDQTVIIELKVVMATMDTYNQIKEYMEIISQEENENAWGIVVSDGAEEEFLDKIKNEKNLYHFNITDLGFETMF